MSSSKQDFGRFVTARRQAMRLTQRDLAERLFVTESAVSKWERALSFPDITLVASLARELGVSEGELINATEDRVGRQTVREARGYRRWRTAILRTTLILYATAVFTCFIVDLSVEHRLGWFWLVLTAVAVAFCLTTLPLLPIRRKGWTTLAASVVSTIVLLVTVWLYTGGGAWLAIAISALLLGVLMIFGPIWLASARLPSWASHHRTVIALVVDTVALGLFLLLVLLAIGRLPLWGARALPIAAISLTVPWGVAVIIRYLPLAGLVRAAIALAYVSVLGCLVLPPAVGWIVQDTEPRLTDLGRWEPTTIGGNVSLIVLIASLLVAAILVVTAVRPRTRQGLG